MRESKTVEYAREGETVKPSGADKSEGGAVGCVHTARTSRDGVAHPRRARQSVEMDSSVRMWPNIMIERQDCR